jgi:hypothetical protein
MIDFYYNSIIQIVSIKFDENGKKNETVSSNIDCIVKSYNRIIVNNKGEEVTAEMKIRFDNSVNIEYGDYIRIINLYGVIQSIKDWKIKKIDQIFDFTLMWRTIYL